MKLVFLIFVLSLSVFAKPLVVTNYNYYDIYPTNKHNLEESMDKTSPISAFGSVRHGTVNWKIKYYYKRQRKMGVCSIAEVKTKVDITYHVPKLAKNYKAPKGTRSVFNRYYTILKDYLQKHSDFAVDAASEIEKELVKIKPLNNDCEIIKSDAVKTARAIIKKYKKKNKDYEIRTYEGFLEGVRSEKLL